MVLNDVTKRPGLIVELSAALDSELLCHRDLDAFDELSVPQGLQERVGESEEEQVLNGVLPEVVVDPKHVLLAERAVHHRVQRPRRGEIVADRLAATSAHAVRVVPLGPTELKGLLAPVPLFRLEGVGGDSG